MVLTSLSTYLRSITQESHVDFTVVNNGTCPTSWTMGGTSHNHTLSTHKRAEMHS